MKNRNYLIGMDLGTTGVKTGVFDVSGEMQVQAYQEYPTHCPQSNWAEQDPDDWWNAVTTTLKEVVQKGNIPANEVAAISISSQTPTVLPLDREGHVLHPAMIWADNRAEKQRDRLLHEYHDEIQKTNPSRIQPYHSITKMLWLKEHKPDVFKNTHTFLQCNGYLNYKLTGIYSMDISSAGLQHLFNMHTRKWDHHLCDILDIPAEKLPPLFESSAVIGTVTPEAALETDLASGIVVVAGGVDSAAAALGAGVIGEGEVLYSMGTGSNVVVAEKRIQDRFRSDPRLIIFPHIVPDVDIFIAIMANTGASLKWFRNELAHVEALTGKILNIDPYELLSVEAEKSEPGAGRLIYLPYLSGELSPIWNPNARGVLFGLSSTTTKAQIVRALMEGCSYALRQNLDIIAEVTNAQYEEIIITGGPTQSSVWMQIIADLLNRPIALPLSEGAPLGNAILAGIGAGIYSDFGEAVKTLIKKNRRYTPVEESRSIYDDLFHIYCRLYEKIQDEFDYLAQVGRR